MWINETSIIVKELHLTCIFFSKLKVDEYGCLGDKLFNVCHAYTYTSFEYDTDILWILKHVY